MPETLDGSPETFAGSPIADPQSVGLSTFGLERLSRAIEREVAAGKAPGCVAMIARAGRIGYARAFGRRTPGGGDMPLDALFRIYSMTKPIVSVAVMTLVEEGRLFLSDPLSKFAPEFAEATVGVETALGLERVALRRPITVQDLLRHTSGLTYGFTGESNVQRLLAQSGFMSQEKTTAEHVRALAGLPLMHQPGEAWEYSVSTDVLGYIVEQAAGAGLDEVLRARVFEPLGMTDTAFYTPPEKLGRRAEPASAEAFRAQLRDPMSRTEPPRAPSGGGGLVSTLPDYARFLAMLSRGGELDGRRVLSPRTVRFMVSDHLDPHVDRRHPLLSPGYGFGLGFTVRTAPGLAPTVGSVGEYSWGGIAGTTFFVSPQDDAFAILMMQAPEHRDHVRTLFRNLVYAAME